MQLDGDFQIFDNTDLLNPIWSSGTGGNPGAFLTIERDGIINIKNNTFSQLLLWSSSNTYKDLYYQTGIADDIAIYDNTII
jgi:hypothetical protein